MMVMSRRAWHICMLTGRQVEPFHDPELGQQIQRAEERGPTDAESSAPRGGLELGRGEVAAVLGDQICDGTARPGQAIAAGIERLHDWIGRNHPKTIPTINAVVEIESHSLSKRFEELALGATLSHV
jgi:hypothetical protein